VRWQRGIVTEVDGEAVKVRVQLVEDGIVTDWLPVGQALTLGAREYQMPRKDAQVVVLLDEHAEDGVVLCGVYSKADPAPVTDPMVWHKEFEDGTALSYDPSAKKLTATMAGSVEVTAQGDVSVSTQGNASVEAQGGATVQAGGQALVKGATIKLEGPTEVDGDLTCTGKGTFAGDLSTSANLHATGTNPAHHTHPVTSGGTASYVP